LKKVFGVTEDAVRRSQKDEVHTFFFCGLNFFVDRWHFFALAPKQNGDAVAHANHGTR
jgi:hypothetical protein